jgi:type II protein arginine methyltransferase
MTTDAPEPLRALGKRFDLLATAAGGNPRKLAALSLAAQECGRVDLVYPLAREARSLAPRDPEVLALTQGAFADRVQEWHQRMVRDTERNERYRAAIERMVRHGDRVLDIGTGTGLLAMIAARAGAAHVWSCEAVPAIADMARDVVALNGFADRITVIAKRSTELDPVADLGGPVDMLISEVIASDIVGENVLPTVEDAARRLLKSGGRMLPLGGEVVIALADVPRLDPFAVEACGFDLSLLGRLGGRPRLVEAEWQDTTLRSSPVGLYCFDFTRGGDWGAVRTTRHLVADGGWVNGVLMWMRLAIDEVETYETYSSRARPSSWALLFYPLDAPRAFAAGDRVTVEAVRRTASIHLWLPDAT